MGWLGAAPAGSERPAQRRPAEGEGDADRAFKVERFRKNQVASGSAIISDAAPNGAPGAAGIPSRRGDAVPCPVGVRPQGDHGDFLIQCRIVFQGASKSECETASARIM